MGNEAEETAEAAELKLKLETDREEEDEAEDAKGPMDADKGAVVDCCG